MILGARARRGADLRQGKRRAGAVTCLFASSDRDV